MLKLDSLTRPYLTLSLTVHTLFNLRNFSEEVCTVQHPRLASMKAGPASYIKSMTGANSPIVNADH